MAVAAAAAVGACAGAACGAAAVGADPRLPVAALKQRPKDSPPVPQTPADPLPQAPHSVSEPLGPVLEALDSASEAAAVAWSAGVPVLSVCQSAAVPVLAPSLRADQRFPGPFFLCPAASWAAQTSSARYAGRQEEAQVLVYVHVLVYVRVNHQCVYVQVIH